MIAIRRTIFVDTHPAQGLKFLEYDTPLSFLALLLLFLYTFPSLQLLATTMHVSPHETISLSPEFQDLRRDDIWFEDGNLILQTDDALFRVYSGLLAARSSVFKDMLAFPPPPEGNLNHDGCPVVRIYDSTSDVRAFLNAIFDSG